MNLNYPVKIVGCVVDVHNLTMYKADGDTIVIPQGDPRVKELVALLQPALSTAKPKEERFLILTGEEMRDKNHFAEAEKKMGGVVRFFKMVKSKAKELLEKFVEPVEPMELGDKREPVKSPPEPVLVVAGKPVDPPAPEHKTEPVKAKLPPAEERPLTKSENAVAEIMANARPSSSPHFSTPDVKGEEETTVIAVLADNTIIPGCEALLDQAQAVAEGVSSGTGMENFMRRAGMIKRGHSVEDLLKFIQKGELPIADDGCVLVYKLLNRTSVEGEFVDVHSGRVKQRVGSRVHMAEHLVDARRSQDCSNGLHVARRDYLSSFSGDVCVLAKLAPEDVIAVPQYDARKLRAKGYTIIAELTDSDRRLVCSNKPMEDQVLLGNAIKGNHAEIIEYVGITQNKGGGLVVTKVADAVEGMPALDQNLKADSLDHLPTEEFCVERNSVDARALALSTAAPAEPAAEGPDGADEAYFREPEPKETVSTPPATPAPQPVKVQQAKPVDLLVQKYLDPEITVLDRYHAAKALIDYKKQSKKSWTALGVSITIWEGADQLVKDGQPAIAAPAPAKPKPAAKKAPAKKAAPAKPAAPKAPTTKEPKMTQQESMAKLVEIYNRNPDKQNAKEIVAFKQKAKKSWDVLGVTDAKFIKKITERAKL